MNEESAGMRLLQKGKRGILSMVFSRFGLMLLMLLLQVGLLFSMFRWFYNFIPLALGSAMVFSLAMVIYLLNIGMDPSAKITWLIVLMLFPVFGGLLLWFTRSEWGHRALKALVNYVNNTTRDQIPQDETVAQQFEQEAPGPAAMARYLRRSGCHNVYANTAVTYFPLGEEKWQAMLRELEQAKDFIFMEYFIIDEGIMWGKVLDILARKAKEGVDVRVMYDGTCEFTTLSHDYPARMKELGIQCKMFAPVTPFLSTHYNYRDHRKILVIDGHTAFNGGVNLADEYINRKVRFGHWKDTAVMLKGDAVKGFTLMFLQMWCLGEKNIDFARYTHVPVPPVEAPGYVIPYGDSPMDDDKTGEKVYMDILNRAVRYVHVMTPYLILDGELETALRYAAERGVDVRLILPGIPDKAIPYALAKTHYAALLESGVKIYEYTPGFVHAKVFIADDQEAVCGTINLDYRSLYHHFECATYLYGVPCIQDMEQDYQATLAACRSVTPKTIRQEKRSVKLMGLLLKGIAPLL